MKPIAITVSVQYSDKLPYILSNMDHLEYWYFVVDRNDTPTLHLLKSVQKKHESVRLLFFDAFRIPGATFNKSGALRYAQTVVHEAHPDDFILILDSDIVLPSQFSETLSTIDLEKTCLYGCRRFDFASKQDFLNQKGHPYATLKKHHFVGYFQMYFRKDALYAPFSVHCGDCDVDFLETYFPKASRHLLPEISVQHLGHSLMNWNGRQEPAW